MCTVIGWGKKEDKKRKSPAPILHASISILSLSLSLSSIRLHFGVQKC